MALNTESGISKKLATFIAKVADSKLAKDILILELTDIEYAPSDYFVICTCESTPQVEAVLWEINRKVKELHDHNPKIEGIDAKEWVLMHYFDVVVHIFIKYARNFYQLEKLWGDAKFYQISEAGRLRKMTDAEIKRLIKVIV